MIKIRGKQFSEDTIAEALEAYCNFEEKSYIFQAGDVVNYEGMYRIIIRYNSKLVAFNLQGSSMSSGQKDFEDLRYKKIGTLTDYIKN